jgi:putative flippase GtrA
MFKKLLVAESSHIGIQFLRYGFVAVAAQVVDFGLLFVFTRYLHIFYLLSATLSFSISLVLNYALCSFWVFSKQSSRRAREIFVFSVVAGVGLVLNLLIIWFCTSVLGIFYLKSKLIAIVFVFFWSFIARRYLAFRGQTAEPDSESP